MICSAIFLKGYHPSINQHLITVIIINFGIVKANFILWSEREVNKIKINLWQQWRNVWDDWYIDKIQKNLNKIITICKNI